MRNEMVGQDGTCACANWLLPQRCQDGPSHPASVVLHLHDTTSSRRIRSLRRHMFARGLTSPSFTSLCRHDLQNNRATPFCQRRPRVATTRIAWVHIYCTPARAALGMMRKPPFISTHPRSKRSGPTTIVRSPRLFDNFAVPFPGGPADAQRSTSQLGHCLDVPQVKQTTSLTSVAESFHRRSGGALKTRHYCRLFIQIDTTFQRGMAAGKP